MRLKKTSAWHQ